MRTRIVYQWIGEGGEILLFDELRLAEECVEEHGGAFARIHTVLERPRAGRAFDLYEALETLVRAVERSGGYGKEIAEAREELKKKW